jgi:hypothetical protein
MKGLLLPLLALQAHAFSPDLQLILPRGAQVGTEAEFRFHGDRLADPREILFHRSGIEVLKLEAIDPKQVLARVRIAPDAPLGEHPLRLRTGGGVSYLRSIWIGPYPVVAEVDPNDSFDQPQRVPSGTTIEGTSKTEDVDTYAVTLKKGEPLAVEVEAMRLGRTFFDAYVAILDPNRFELASCDDAALTYTDAFASIVAPADGEYRIVVREAAYEGNDACQYRLHIGPFPRPSGVFPNGARPGETIDFRFIGDASGDFVHRITVPADASGRFPIFGIRDGKSSPSPNWIEVSPLTPANEAEPNEKAQNATVLPAIPCAVHGILEQKSDADTFRFTAKKDQNLDIRILARALRSPLDSVLVLRDGANKNLVNNDDQGSPDSIIAWTCPADGEYLLSVRDKLGRSGPDFTYRLEINTRSPAIRGTLPVFERDNSQARKVIPVPAGNRYATVVNLTRTNLACDARLEAAALPPGVTLHVPPVPRSLTSFPVIFECAPGTEPAGNYYDFRIHASGENAPAISGPLAEEIHQIEVNNQGPYHSNFSNKIAVATTVPAPLTVSIDPPPAPVVPNGSMKLKIRVARQEAFQEAVTIRFLWKPPGIGAPDTLPLEAGKSEMEYEVNANPDAAAADWPICVLAETNTPAGPVQVASSFVTLRIAQPWVNATLDLAATEQGKDVPVIAKLESLRPFTGKARAELIGLPHGAATDPLEFDSGAAELHFPIRIAKDAAVGKHSGLFLRIHIPETGSTVLHQCAQGGTLRIDAPPPPVANQAPAAPKPAAPPPPPGQPAEKPLSRLEQLRQRANAP